MTATDDLRALIAATPGAVDVVSGALALPLAGILDFEGQGWGNPEQAQVGVEVITLTYCYPDLPGLTSGSPLTVDGTAYIVSQGPHRKADGREAVVVLEEA
jgi:hypothetical protein